jgi:hypothetical protein
MASSKRQEHSMLELMDIFRTMASIEVKVNLHFATNKKVMIFLL